LLSQVREGQLGIEDALSRLRYLSYENLGFARIDHHRALRQGFPEVIFGEGKTIEQVATIAEKMVVNCDRLLVTRVSQECFEVVQERIPQAVYNPVASAIIVNCAAERPSQPGLMIISAGTADLPVAEEAAITAELMGNVVERAFDVGVAGLHRLLDLLPSLQQAKVIVVVAGMDGVLPSVIGGLVSVPVIAVPTSVGYGASFKGLAALLTMLNSCSPGVAVVNIDNGFGAGYLAGMINCSLG
jgi:hypothetical protein